MQNKTSFILGLLSLIGIIAVYVGLALTGFSDENANPVLKFAYIFGLFLFLVLPIVGLAKNRGFSAGLILCIVALAVQLAVIALSIAASV